jgi:DNA-binding transcriptional MerR regulator
MTDVTDSPRAATDGASMTIDELAHRTGMTVRNIRAHQSRGLVPPPEVMGRTGYYGEDHVGRIELIQELQADGFNLESIRKLLEGAGGSSAEVLNFSRTLRAPFEDEQSEILTEAEFAERWGGPLDARLMARTEKLGLVRDLGDGPHQRAPSLTRLHRSVPGERLEAVQRRGAAGGGLAQGARRARAAASAGVRGAARDLPASDERDGRGGHRPRDPAGAERLRLRSETA